MRRNNISKFKTGKNYKEERNKKAKAKTGKD